MPGTSTPPTEDSVLPQAPRRSLWRHRDFRLLWGGQTVSELGASVSSLALPLVAVAQLGASAFQAALLTAASWSGYLLATLPAGPLADRMSRRRLLVWCDIGRAAVTALIPIAALAGVLTLAQLYVVTVVTSVLSAVFDVAYPSYLPSLVDKDQLVDANGKLSTAGSVAQLAGPSLAGVLVSSIGATRAVVADAASFVVSVLSLLAIRTPEAPPEPEPEAESQPRRQVRAEILDALRFLLRHRILRSIAASSALSNLFVAMALALELVFLVRDLHAQPWQIGFVMLGGAVGGLLGGLLTGRLAKRIGTARMIWLPFLALGWSGLLAPLARGGWGVYLVAVGSLVFAASSVPFNAAATGYRQAICPPESLGRVNAASRWLSWGTAPVGAVLGGLLGDWIGVRTTLVVAGFGAWACCLFVLCSPLRRMRDIPE
ncbi:MFS transporter [Solihabitans fulvus]|uniref:MFS transporter n=1 Tax=Solihabitans fulvus TaxID=1892852 RepID=A0A5B2WJD0_9PSEU|nr:MFS transporter [Solihabitans fulvus]KAA2252183.1 MFS transporter [Solihabitans fulvus]